MFVIDKILVSTIDSSIPTIFPIALKLFPLIYNEIILWSNSTCSGIGTNVPVFRSYLYGKGILPPPRQSPDSARFFSPIRVLSNIVSLSN